MEKLSRKTYLSMRKSDPGAAIFFDFVDKIKTASVFLEQITKHLCSDIAAFAVVADADLAYLW